MVGHFRPRDVVKGVPPYCFYEIFFSCTRGQCRR